jgi:hypothetical protein
MIMVEISSLLNILIIFFFQITFQSITLEKLFPVILIKNILLMFRIYVYENLCTIFFTDWKH